MTEFGKAIRILRIENNRKQKQDAEALGVTASYISAIENGKKPVSDRYLEYCIKTYGNKDRLTELAEKQNHSTEKIAVVRCRDCKHWITVLDKDIAESGLCNKYSQLETTKAYDLGHEDGEKSMQEKVNKLCEYWINNKTSTIIELFGGMTWEQIFGDVETAYNKVMYYENEKEEIHVGDVVKDIVGVKTLLVTNVVNSYVYTLDKDGRDGVRNKNDVVKTGEHYPLDEFLKGLK